MVEVHTIDRGAATYYGSYGSGVSWKAVAAGAIASLASTLVLLTLCTGIGLSVVSPWPGQGANVSGMSAGAISMISGLTLVIIAAISSAVGGYVAGRLGSRWVNVHSDEIYFRDTAHGFVAWGLATLVAVACFGSVATTITSGAVSGAAAGGTAMASNVDNNDVNIATDRLFRAGPEAQITASAPGTPANNAEIYRLLAKSVATGTELAQDDRVYLVSTVSARTGLSPEQADQRVTQVLTQSREAVDAARKTGAHAALWMTLALMVGAFTSSLVATRGAVYRDKYPTAL